MSNETIYVNYSYRRRNIDGGDPLNGRLAEGRMPHLIHNSVNRSAKNPNWRDDIKNGNCATTYLSGIRETLQRSPAKFSVRSPHGDWCEGSDIDFQLPWRASDPALSSVALADSRARAKLISKANEYQRPFTGGVALGELRETLRMIKSPAASLFQAIKRHIADASRKTRRHKKGTEHYRKVASGLWLETVFGLIPFFSDLESGAKAYRQLAENASRRRKLIIANGEDEDITDANVSESSYGTLDVKCHYAYRQSARTNVRYRAMLQWDNHTYSKFRYFGLTPENILPTAWELVPWSFLVDYFFNIGEMIEGMSFGTQRLRWIDRGEMKHSRREFRLIKWGPNLSPNGPGSGWFIPETLVSQRVTVSRNEVLKQDFDTVPDFHFEIPGSRQFANMAALFSNKRNFL